jgi:hypothetical protein
VLDITISNSNKITEKIILGTYEEESDEDKKEEEIQEQNRKRA